MRTIIMHHGHLFANKPRETCPSSAGEYTNTKAEKQFVNWKVLQKNDQSKSYKQTIVCSSWEFYEVTEKTRVATKK